MLCRIGFCRENRQTLPLHENKFWIRYQRYNIMHKYANIYLNFATDMI